MVQKYIKTAKSIALRKTQAEDIGFVRQAESHHDNALYVLQWTEAQHLAATHNPDIMHFIIEELPSKTISGYGIIAGLQTPDKIIELKRIVVTRKGLGLGRALIQLVKKMCFDDLACSKLWLDVIEDNDKAIALYKSEGFTEEGFIGEPVIQDGVSKSFILMSMYPKN